MNAPFLRSAVTPLRRTPRTADGLPSVLEVVAARRPADPLVCLRPGVLTETARRFVAAFPGDVLYAVKCDPEPAVLRALYAGGIRHFDVASPAELRLVRQLFPSAEAHFMHPVKARPAIREAHALGCRTFVLDTLDELLKIGDETRGAPDLTLVVRLALPKTGAFYDLGGKFGAQPGEAVELLRASRRLAAQLGVCFHVGSQCLDPAAYQAALALAGEVVARAGVPIELLDVGGGFPAAYPGMTPPPLDDFLAAIASGVARLALPGGCRLWCEPGRALVATGGSLVVQVLLRRGRALYLNDGVYGSLADAGRVGMRFPARLIRPSGEVRGAPVPFRFFGPTCDSADRMDGPFLLPDDVREGDWIELGQLGAYGSCMRTAFNGYGAADVVEVRDPPLLDDNCESFAESVG